LLKIRQIVYTQTEFKNNLFNLLFAFPITILWLHLLKTRIESFCRGHFYMILSRIICASLGASLWPICFWPSGSRAWMVGFPF